jgi:hypothetical protein
MKRAVSYADDRHLHDAFGDVKNVAALRFDDINHSSGAQYSSVKRLPT